MKKRYLAVFMVAVLVIACATSPTGRRQLMIVSEDRAIAASKQAYVEMIKPYEEKGKVDNDPALKDRVYRITGRLIAQAIIWRPETKNWDWSIKVIDDPKTVNAWAMAGGKGPPEFFSTHPSPENREKKLAEYVPEMTPYYEQKGERPFYKL